MTDEDRLTFHTEKFKIENGGDVCPECLGTGAVIVEEKGTRYARPCACRAAVVTARRRAAAGIPARYRECSLDNFHVVPGIADDTTAGAKRLAARFVACYPAVDAGLLFMGPCGVGKTHLATAIINSLLTDKGVRCRFCDFADLLTEIKKAYAEMSFDESAFLAPLVQAEVLLIDDLGSMKIRDWTLDILSFVINQRYVRKKLIIATTNFLDEAGPGEETLSDRIGPRLRSRLLEMCKTVLMLGKDWRREHSQVGLLRHLG